MLERYCNQKVTGVRLVYVYMSKRLKEHLKYAQIQTQPDTLRAVLSTGKTTTN